MIELVARGESGLVKLICPHCGEPAPWKENPFRPFCSDKCKALDLGDWAMEKFRVEGEKVEISSAAPRRSADDPEED